MPTNVTSAPASRAPPVLRFAPSPNGWLHLGHALSALVGFELARRLGGRFLLRIEDIDPARSRPEHVDAILRDLAWLGIAWEEPVLRQSQMMVDYAAAAARLDAMGLLYPCFATRAEVHAAASASTASANATKPATDPDGAPLYPGLHRGMPASEVARRRALGETPVMRLDMAAALGHARTMSGGDDLSFEELTEVAATRVACRPARWGDVVLQRRDTPTSYHLSVVVDDARQGITLVTRGRDLYAATDVHRLLQVLLALPVPLYLHHRLLTDAHGRKLAKSARDTSLATLRAGGTSAAEVRRLAGIDDPAGVGGELQRIVRLWR